MYVIFDTLLSVYQDACNGTGDSLNVCVYNRDDLNNEETELDTQNCSKAD